MSDKKTVRHHETCGACDGDGYAWHCDDYLDTICCVGWDIVCDDCKGKGWYWRDFMVPDPKWAREWKLINREATS